MIIKFKHTIHNRSQLDEDPNDTGSRPTLFHHQNPFVPRNLYEGDLRARNLRRKLNQQAANRSLSHGRQIPRGEQSKPKPVANTSASSITNKNPQLTLNLNEKSKIEEKSENEMNLQTSDSSQTPDSPNRIPPPWKITSVSIFIQINDC